MKTIHEEAAAIIPHAVIYLASFGCCSIKVISDNTELFVLLVHYYALISWHIYFSWNPQTSQGHSSGGSRISKRGLFFLSNSGCGFSREKGGGGGGGSRSGAWLEEQTFLYQPLYGCSKSWHPLSLSHNHQQILRLKVGKFWALRNAINWLIYGRLWKINKIYMNIVTLQANVFEQCHQPF